MIARMMHAVAALGALALCGAAAPASAQPLSPSPSPSQPLPAPPRWSAPAAEALLGYAGDIGREGLDPALFPVSDLVGALSARDADRIDLTASRLFVALALALGEGVVPPEGRADWHIPGPALSDAQVAMLAGKARTTGDPGAVLKGLLPDHPHYRALRTALAAQRDPASAESMALRVNMERWRWMPRSLGGRYLIANVPEYQVRLVEGGRTLSVHRNVVGKPSTPTPQLLASVTGVVLNPNWTVPQSIIAESIGRLVRSQPAEARKRGYVATALPGGGMRVVQVPGPGNALGQVKLAMPNPWSIYLHDTPAKALFEKDKRAFSHGCLRTEGIMDLAAMLLADQPQWTPERIAEVIAAKKTVLVPLSGPMPVYVVYFTRVADEADGVRAAEDLYGRDASVARMLSARR